MEILIFLKHVSIEQRTKLKSILNKHKIAHFWTILFWEDGTLLHSHVGRRHSDFPPFSNYIITDVLKKANLLFAVPSRSFSVGLVLILLPE